MSNHHSDIDVDDVLSSVRRLVADESDGERRKRQEQAADRLVLTPSLRVADPEEGEAEADVDAPIEAELAEATKLSDTSEDEAVEASVVEEDMLDEAFEEEKQLSQTDSTEQADVDPVEESSDEAEALTAELQSLENETVADEDAALHGPTETSLRAISLEDRIAELEAAVNAQRDEFEPDGSEDQAQHVPDTALQSSPEVGELEPERAPDVEEEPETTAEPAIEDEAIVEPEAPDFDESAVEEVSAEAEATLEVGPAAALSFRHRGFGAPPVTETAEPDLDEAVEAEEAVDVEETVLSDTSEPAPSDDAILDEDALRELVGQLVRQELQGDLGERITRNVRKLVRREIQIALAARSLEKD